MRKVKVVILFLVVSAMVIACVIGIDLVKRLLYDTPLIPNMESALDPDQPATQAPWEPEAEEGGFDSSDSAYDDVSDVPSDTKEENEIQDDAKEDDQENDDTSNMEHKTIVMAEAAPTSTQTAQSTFATGEGLAEGNQADTDEFASIQEPDELHFPKEILDKLYSPFTVLDISMSKAIDVTRKPKGGGSPGKLYGGQVGIEVVNIEGDYAFIKANRYPGGRPIEGYVKASLLKTVTPDDRYSILIDKREQRLYFFEYGKLIDEMVCSTGTMLTETPAGEFLKIGTKEKITADSTPEVAQWGVHLNGRVYIHGIPSIRGNYEKAIDMLGKKASHGCIRVPVEKAKWFYDNLPDNTKVIILEYRGETPANPLIVE